MSKADGPITARSPTLIVPRDLYELHRRIKALKLDPGKGFASQLVKRADGASGDVAATKWPADVSLFVNDASDGTQIDVWHDGVCGGPTLTATSAESARAIIGAIDELHGLREELTRARQDYADLTGLLEPVEDVDVQEVLRAAGYRTEMQAKQVPTHAHAETGFLADSAGPVVRALVQARERLADFQADYRKVMSDQCAPDEGHCSCVPHLRARIAELERERVDLINGADLAADRANRHRQERDAARVEIAHLQDELIKLRGAHGPTDQAEVAPDPNALPGGGEGAVTALLMDYGIVDTPETRQQMRDTLMSALRAGAGPDGYYPARPAEDTGAPAWLRLEWSGASIAPVPYVVDPLPTHPATPTIPAARLRVLHDAHDERGRQDAKFGRDRDHALTYGGFEGRPMDLCAAYGIPTADYAKARCDAAMRVGRVTYGHILVEEVCEFFEAAAGGSVAEVRKELVQVVAVGVAMVEALDRAARRLA